MRNKSNHGGENGSLGKNCADGACRWVANAKHADGVAN